MSLSTVERARLTIENVRSALKYLNFKKTNAC